MKKFGLGLCLLALVLPARATLFNTNWSSGFVNGTLVPGAAGGKGVRK